LKFGDEGLDSPNESEREAEEEEYEPLLKYLKTAIGDLVKDGTSLMDHKNNPLLYLDLVIITNRLVISPCAIVADTFGYSANMERLMS
jgi:heat shock protein beta